mgnify:FL=1
MSIERARSWLAQFGADQRILELEQSSATVALAAEALGCAPERIAKTLSFMLDGNPILIVAAGDARIDNHRYKASFGSKAKMLSPDEAADLVGHAVGGVCPFGVNEGTKVYLDESLRRFETVFPACGSSNSAIRLTIPELEQFSASCGWVDVCKDWQQNDNAGE